MDSGATFTFDTKPFMQSLKNMDMALGRSVQSMKGLGSQITKSVGSAVTGVLGKIATLGVAFLGVKQAMQAMPVVGQSLSVMKDIFMKNFFWPLQKEIMPLLQKMLAWFTSNRATFVRWGGVLVNIFRSVMDIGRRVYEMLKQVTSVISGAMKEAFGFSKMDEFINTLMLKVHFVILYITKLVSGVLGSVPQLFEFLIKNGTQVLNTVIKWVKDIVQAVQEAGLVTALFEAIGKAIEAIIKIGTSALDGVVRFLTDIVIIGKDGSNLSSLLDTLGDMWTMMGNIVSSAFDGFWDGLLSTMTDLMPVLNIIADIFKTTLSGANLGSIGKGFEGIGKILGGTLIIALRILGTALSAVVQVLDTMVTLFTMIGAEDWKEKWADLGTRSDIRVEQNKQMWSGLSDQQNEYLAQNGFNDLRANSATATFKKDNDPRPISEEQLSSAYASDNMRRRRDGEPLLSKEDFITANGYKRINDGIITPQGEIVKTNPEDYILATTNPERMASNIIQGVQSNQGMNFSVTFGDVYTNGNPKQEATQFADTFASKIQQQMLERGWM